MSGDRFHAFCRRARTCYRGSGSLDSLRRELENYAAELDAENTPHAKAAAVKLRAIASETAAAQLFLKQALNEAVLKADSREPGFWPVEGNPFDPGVTR